MNTPNQLLTLLSGLLIFSACGDLPKAPPPPGTNTVNTPPPAITKPEVFLYAVHVDNLLLREQPNKQGNVLAKLKEGDFVTGSGEKSANKEEAMLRGITYEEPYYRATTTTPEQQQGWVYGGGVSLVYTGPRATSPDLGRLTQLAAFFKTLDTKKINSGKKAWDYVAQNFADATGPLADAAYIMLMRFGRRMEFEGEFYKYTDIMADKWTPEDFTAIYNNTFDMNKYPVTKELAANGFVLETGEGMVFPVPDWTKQNAFFQSKVTPPMQAYLTQTALEKKDLESEDGGLVISLDQLAERAIFWEKFNATHPYFPLADETKSSQRWMTDTFVTGMDNTPVVDFETKGINPDFQKAWAAVQQKYPGTKLAQVCKDVMAQFAASGNKYTEQVEQWQTEYLQKLYEESK
jgi:hypothetical protein